MRKLLTIFTLLLLTQSCTKEVDVSQGEASSEAVKFTASVVDVAQSKAAPINSWSGDEEVALFVDGDESVYHFTIAEDGTMTGDDVIVDREEEITYKAFYPYDADLSTIEEYEAACTPGTVDYMSATTTTSGKAVELQFTHSLAALLFKVLIDSEVTDTVVALALDGNISSALDLEVEATNISSTATMLEANYFVENGTDISSALITVKQGGSTAIHSIDREDTNILETGKQYIYMVGFGAGTEDAPHLVYTAEDMRKVGTGIDGWNLDSHYILAQDIDLGGIDAEGNGVAENEFTAIGTYQVMFTGTFDGGGHKISGLYINKPESDHQGLFGCTFGATIKNISVSGSVTGDDRVGGIVGSSSSSAIISSYVSGCCNTANVTGEDYVGGIAGQSFSCMTDCYNTGSITGEYNVGGVAGRSSYDSMSDCYNEGSVEGSDDYVGGVIGYASKCKIARCINRAATTGSSSIAGIVGRISNYGVEDINDYTITDCDNYGAITGREQIGGIVGEIENSSSLLIENCNNHAAITANGDNAGGIASILPQESIVSHCNNYAVVSSTGFAGGIVGQCEEDKKRKIINTCYNEGNVHSSGYFAGGIVGKIFGETNNDDKSVVVNCASVGNVSATNKYVGGLVGANQGGMVLNSYSTGEVSGSSEVGGLVGIHETYNDSSQALIDNCYSNAEVSCTATDGSVGLLIGKLNDSFAMYCYYNESGTASVYGVNNTDIDATVAPFTTDTDGLETLFNALHNRAAMLQTEYGINGEPWELGNDGFPTPIIYVRTND